ncbi:MAG: AMP-binding protein [Candidatus Hodarchaeota archaeon]
MFKSIFTPKEADFFKRLNQTLKEFDQNPNLSTGICIEQWAGKVPDKKVLFHEEKFWTWQTFNEESNKIANFLIDLEFKPGDAVAIMMENSPQYLFIETGINKIQGICSLININQRKSALIHAIKISEPKYFIVDGDCLPAFKDVFEDLNFMSNKIFVLNNPSKKKHEFVDFTHKLKSVSIQNPKTTFNSKLSDKGYYIFTSGTTGLPKATVLRNERMGHFYSLVLQLNPDDIIYDPLPLYHSHSNGAWRGVVYSGAALALRKRFSASEFWKDILKFKATGTLYIGEIPRYLLNRPKSEYVKNTTLTKMMGVGLRKDIWERFQLRFNIKHILEFYGSTEGMASFVNFDEIPGMIGRLVLPRIKLAKVNQETGEFYKDENGFCIKCAPGEIGMLLAKIEDESNLTLYKDKYNTEQKILRNVFEKDDVYFNSGDLIQLHEDHRVSFADRFGDTFRWKGENVSTLEVESILNTFPSIQMCTVYGVNIPNTEGKAGMVTITLKESHKFNSKKFAKFVIENLPKYSIPIFVRVQNELEFTGTYKLKKFNLQKQGYDINKIKDTIYLWNSSTQSYKLLNMDDYMNILTGKYNI